MQLTLSAWWLLLLIAPVLWLGEGVCRQFALFRRFNIPPPVVGGLIFSLLLLLLRISGLVTIEWQTRVSAGAWTWWVTPETEWVTRPEKPLNLPFLVGFFTCIGLNATWRVLKSGSGQLLLFLGLATVLTVVQNGVGVGLARLLGESPLLGLLCGGVTLTGGHGTALGFAQSFEQAGLAGAATVGAAAATFGLVLGGLLSGPLGTWLIERHRLAVPRAGEERRDKSARLPSWFSQTARLLSAGRVTWGHLLLLLFCIKAGAWISYLLQRAGLVFPVYMGALLLGLALRNLVDFLAPGRLRSEVIDQWGSLLLGVFLVMTLSSLNLAELAAIAGPMFTILLLQVPLTLAFIAWVTWRLLGRDYEASIMAAGHAGFGLGTTATAVAAMDSLTRRYGPAPRAYTVVPPTGAFLIDFTNALAITLFMNLLL